MPGSGHNNARRNLGMMRKLFILPVIVLSLSLLFSAGLAIAESGGVAHRLVIQVSDDNPRTMKIALNNAMNVIKAVGQDNIKVEIVAYGPGLKLLMKKNKAYRDRISSMQFYGVRFAACGNTMKHFKVSKEGLVNGVSVVKAGVLEIMEKEEQGWSYIRP